MPSYIQLLTVDDSEEICNHFSEAFSFMAEVRVATETSTSGALRWISSMCERGGELDLVTTDLNRPPMGRYEGFDLIRAIRGLSDEMTTSRGLRVRHLPVIVISASATDQTLRNEVHSIDPEIQVLVKPVDLDRIIEEVDVSLRIYRDHVLGDLHRRGYGVYWEAGRIKVATAYAVPPGQFETKYFVGPASSVSSGYQRLLLVHDTWATDQAAVDRFETVINDPRTTEKRLQEFLQAYPEFLEFVGSDVYWAQPVLKGAASGKSIRPDFLLEPHARRSVASNWTAVELKRADSPVIAHRRFHRDFAANVHRGIAQLRDYSEFFANPENHDYLRRRFSGVIPRPRLVLCIGRLPADHDAYSELRRRYDGVQITTYDEVLDFRRARMSRVRSAPRLSWTEE